MPYKDEAQATKKRAAAREWRQKNHERAKAAQRARYAQNKEEVQKKAAAYRSDPEHRERAKQRSAEWRERNRHRKREYSRAAYLKSRYGLAFDRYNQMLADQGHACAICGDTLPTNWICVDHCHASGTVRALLCAACNAAIGLVKERPEVLRAAATYLESHLRKGETAA